MMQQYGQAYAVPHEVTPQYGQAYAHPPDQQQQ